ncbi:MULTISPECIES: DUF1801 domain-containing protein [Streptosporangium]|uniref:YdhG-like domain-containing protein n=1 Tax=Streptosporangium brasiliense TaxID=47480 RepID=A0ABT9R7K0_9ACTN|nr:DUF1801 domain-containing protein [Streptosporangium brasiliense]MDP9864861.1 hypothetical protein [Streptosporangium brasiliense]
MTKPATVTEYAAALDPALREIAEKLQTIVDTVFPQAGAVWHGHPVWSLGPAPGKTPVAYFKAYSSYVTFGLWRGQEISDPSGRLEPAARQMAAVRLRTLADIDPDLFTTWLRLARDLEN